MYRDWPFFRSTLDLIEMVLAKADPRIAARIRPPARAARAAAARRRSARAARRDDRAACSTSPAARELLDDNPVLRRSIDVRNPYVDPINLVQIELLRRLRRAGVDGGCGTRS